MQPPLPPLKPISIKDRVSVLFVERGQLDVLDGSFVLIASVKESPAAYRSISGPENAVLRPQNQYFWEDIRSTST